MRKAILKLFLSDASFGAGTSAFVMSFIMYLNNIDSMPLLIATIYSMWYCLTWVVTHMYD